MIAPSLSDLALAFNWEEIVPIVLFLVYGLSQFISAKRKGSSEEEDGADPEAVERARKIREEIKRKVEERRRAMAEKVNPDTDEGEHGPRYDPTLPDHMQRRLSPQEPDPQPETYSTWEPDPEPQRRTITFPTQSDPLSGGGESLIERQLAEQRERLEAAKREREAARQRAAEMERQAGVHAERKGRIATRAALESARTARQFAFRNQLVKDLKDPYSIRKAILYQEILGTPKGLQ